MGEVGVATALGHQCLCVRYRLAHTIPVIQVAVGLVAKLTETELRITDWRPASRIGILVQFHLVPAHELRPAYGCQPVELLHGRRQLSARLLAKLTAQPLLQMQPECRRVLPVDIPSHVQKQFQRIGSHLQLVYVDNPQSAHIVVVGGLHLVVDESWLRTTEPHIVERTAPIRQVVVDTATTAALLLFGIAQAGHIAVVVVAPRQHHIVGHLQAVLHDTENLLVGHELLGDLFYILTRIFLEQLALVIDDALQPFCLLLAGLHTLHRTVVHTAHANGVDIVYSLDFLQALRPVLTYLLTIGHVVIAAAILHVPFAHIVAAQRLTVRGAYDDAARVGLLLGTGYHIKRCGHAVHTRPDGVGTQTHQQFKDTAVGLGAHTTFWCSGLVGLPTPGL